MRKMTAFLMLAAALACGCAQLEDVPPADEIQKEITGTEEVGGKYNLTLVDTKVTVGNRSSSMKMIRYVKDGEVVEPDMMLSDNMRPGLDWIRENTPEDAVVFCWWDWGHMIRAYAEREPVVDCPSREILAATVSKHIGKFPFEIECPNCVPHDVILDVAGALVARESTEVVGAMEKYGASVLYVNIQDKYNSNAFYISLGMEPAEPDSEEFLGRAIASEEIDGLELLYFDEVARVYVLKS